MGVAVVAQEGDMLRVSPGARPHGPVDEGDFIHSYMGKACNSDLLNAHGERLPR